MVSKAIQEALNKQVQMEAESSQAYLAMASWADIQPGLAGCHGIFLPAIRRRKNSHAQADQFH